ncbi:cell division suppressor protein YneA [Brevibacillus marinus]|uniref:cell division suppressor protein YneA n=1 Tax=Brevibacillus marinus TaxID=2496837 RepID=UPI0013E0DB62|nr:LysM peptidoglycan-binding domain-containing protein [Brevibacillus marinus]
MRKSVHVRRQRVRRRGRIGLTRAQALLVLFACAVFFCLLTGFVLAGGEEAEPVYASYKLVTVQPGDSLWELAGRYQEEAGIERAELIAAIKRANQLSHTLIYPGDNLLIPLAK